MATAAIFVLPFAAKAEKITDFQSDISIKADASISVRETIQYDFEGASRHGIFRNIPVSYKARGGNFNLRLANVRVTDDGGASIPFTSSKSGANMQIKIGDANTLVSGVKTYVISYDVSRAINFFKDHDELYWNATGNNWTVPIEKSLATVTLPKSTARNGLQFDCFAGPYGSSAKCPVIMESGASEVDRVLFGQPAELASGGGLTVVVGFPKGLVSQPTFWQNLVEIIRDNGVLAVPLLVLVLMYYLWHTRGRDPKGFETIVPQYEAPEGLTPTEVGTIVDGSASNQDITADIIYLASRGFIKITRLDKKILFFNNTDYQLDLVKNPTGQLAPFEERMLLGLFGIIAPIDGKGSIQISELKGKFYKDLAEIKNQVYKSTVDKGYFVRNPKNVRAAYMAAAFFVLALGIFLGAKMGSLYAIIAFVLSAIIIFIFSFVMPARTGKGAQARQYILGLKRYLSVAEADRLKFFNAPDKTPERFEKLLPYAMVLGVENEWAKQFEGMYVQPPSWYSDPSGHAFNSVLLASSLHGFSSAANTTFASQPSSHGSGAWGGGSGLGGGGFSGGGFGGGGGGSW